MIPFMDSCLKYSKTDILTVQGDIEADHGLAMEEKNARLLCYSPTFRTDGNKVVGVQCKAEDDTILDIKAKSVIVCTGGFMANEEMIAQYFAGADLLAMCSYSNKGDGIQMAQAADGQLGKNFGISLNECGAGNSKASKRAARFPSEGSDMNGVFYLPILGGLIVNKKGERFFNEAKMCEDTMYSGEVVIRDDLYYSVIDQAYLERLTSTAIIDFLGATSNMAPMIEMTFQGVKLTNIYDSFDEAIEGGWAFKADSIEELAEFFGTDELPATVEQYNQYCEAGKNDEFFKKTSISMQSQKDNSISLSSSPARGLPSAA